MQNYLQHIIQENLWYHSPKHNMVAYSCDERFIKFNRKGIDT